MFRLGTLSDSWDLKYVMREAGISSRRTTIPYNFSRYILQGEWKMKVVIIQEKH